MVLTRATNHRSRRRLGTDDDIQEATNTDSPWVDQSQTYTSHPSHQVFLREYVARRRPAPGRPTGKLIEGAGRRHGHLGRVKAQAADLLGIAARRRRRAERPDARHRPVRPVLRGPNGLPQFVTRRRRPRRGQPGRRHRSALPANAVRTGTRSWTTSRTTRCRAGDHDPRRRTPRSTRPSTRPGCRRQPASTTTRCSTRTSSPATAGQREHRPDRHAPGVPLRAQPARRRHRQHVIADDRGQLADTERPTGAARTGRRQLGYGERLFQAARFVTEMEYQHLVFEEFARKVQPLVNPFGRRHRLQHERSTRRSRPSSPTPSTGSATRC